MNGADFCLRVKAYGLDGSSDGLGCWITMLANLTEEIDSGVAVSDGMKLGGDCDMDYPLTVPSANGSYRARGGRDHHHP